MRSRATLDATLLPLRAGFFAVSILCISAVLSVRALSQPPGSDSNLEKPPVSLVFVLDNSVLEKDVSSTRGVLSAFLRSLRDDDEYAIYVSAEHPELLQDFSDDPELPDALHRTGRNRGNALYDTLIEAVKFLGSDASNDQKILLVMSSGVDTGSKSRLADAIADIKKDAVRLVIMSLPEGGWRGRETLQELATQSGGTTYFPEHKSEFEEVASVVARELMGPPVLRGKPLGRYRYIVVRSIPVADLPHTAEFRQGDNVLLEKILAAKLWEAKIFYRVIDATQQSDDAYMAQIQRADATDTVEISGAIVQYKRGSHLKRGTAGLLGSGVSRLKVRFVFRDVSSRKALLALNEEGAGSGGLLGGGNEQNRREAIERVVNRLLQDIKRYR